MTDFLNSASLLLVLLNPFLLVIYLVNLINDLDKGRFGSVLLRAGIISSVVFCLFAIVGDAIFSNVFRAEFASFQIFGGVIFLMIGLQFVFKGPEAIELLRGEAEHVAGAVAMPVMIGPGTVSASVLVGEKLNSWMACLAVVTAVSISLLVIFLLKFLHDYVKPRKEALINRYIGIAGRIMALYVGTVAVEMIMTGLHTWLDKPFDGLF